MAKGRKYPSKVYPHDPAEFGPDYDPYEKFVSTEGLVILKPGEGKPFWSKEQLERLTKELQDELEGKETDDEARHRETIEEIERRSQEEKRPIDPKDVKP